MGSMADQFLILLGTRVSMFISSITASFVTETPCESFDILMFWS
jgi:hypothetical protein